MFASVRDIVAERAEKLKVLRMELRNLQLLEKRRELEEINRLVKLCKIDTTVLFYTL
jgi:hypothetical protein